MNDTTASEQPLDETAQAVTVKRPIAFNRAAVKPVEHMAGDELDATVAEATRAYKTRVNTEKLWNDIINAASEEESDKLLQGGIDLGYTDVYGNTLLHHALTNGNFRLAVRLLDAGMDPQTKNEAGVSPAAMCAGTLWERITKNAPNEEIETILRCKADLGVTDDDGNSLLHLAAGYNNLWLLARLINAGLDMHHKNAGGVTPLMQCAVGYNLEAPGVMLALADPDPAFHVFEGMHALHAAAVSFDKTRLVEALLRRGVPADIENAEGKTPLWNAVAAKLECAEVLCMAGGFREKDREILQQAIAVEDKLGKKWDWNLLFDFAAKIPQEELKENFPRCGAKNPPLLDAATEAVFTAARNSGGSGFAMEKYFDSPLLDERDYQGRNPLMAGCDRKFSSLWDVRVIAYRTPRDATADDGRTILHYCPQHADSPAKSIIESQMDDHNINAQDAYGNTPLMETMEGCNFLSYFMENGADPFIKNLLGMTAMDRAKMIKSDYAIESLQEEIDKHGWVEDRQYGNYPAKRRRGYSL